MVVFCCQKKSAPATKGIAMRRTSNRNRVARPDDRDSGLFERLPNELVALILSLVPCAVLVGPVALVCRRWNGIASDPSAIGRRPCLTAECHAQPHHLAAAAGHYDCLLYADNGRHAVTDDVLASAVQSGVLSCVLHSRRYTGQDMHGAYDAAIRSGRVDLVSPLDDLDDWLVRMPEALVTAASCGRVDVMAHLHRRGHPLTIGVSLEAASEGRLECLTFAHDHGCPWTMHAHCAAACNGHLDCLQYLDRHGCPRDVMALGWAASEGHLDVVRYLHQQSGSTSMHRLDFNLGVALRRGHLDVVVYMRENGCGWCDDPCAEAANSGRLDIVTFVHRQGCVLTPLTCATAAAHGHLDIVAYARDNGCPWDAQTCAAAATYGHLDVLAYAHDRGCPWDDRICHRAAKYGHLGCLVYAQERGCPVDALALHKALVGGRHDCCVYIHDLLCCCGMSFPTDPRLHGSCRPMKQVNDLAVTRGWDFSTRREGRAPFWRVKN
ncbi:Ankyrin repeat domain containing protein [Pandoravirus neocaledonia]|uniref:Ankyrin repeat domain containing protein n=1 Tax=Pandoravirus neocaledonia TaxID=2107708 RepID=A0A2U7UDX5_9VIRU|nr:Ankyrin repeat domain containing protein [Pandoravirus neocaledonia]AVK76636.1 Ankyrin repeat domain containing protein [Pandoravirus neocaledonia]